MNHDKLVKFSFASAAGVAVYVLAIAWVMSHGKEWFKPEDTFLAPATFLMLFVLSATVVGSLVLGKPAMLYLSGSKKDGLRLFGYTVGWLVAGTIVLLLLNLK